MICNTTNLVISMPPCKPSNFPMMKICTSQQPSSPIETYKYTASSSSSLIKKKAQTTREKRNKPDFGLFPPFAQTEVNTAFCDSKRSVLAE